MWGSIVAVTVVDAVDESVGSEARTRWGDRAVAMQSQNKNEMMIKAKFENRVFVRKRAFGCSQEAWECGL